MDIKTFFYGMPKPARKEFADKCGTTVGYMQNVCYGYKSLGAKACVKIEQATNGVVTRKDLKPTDWKEIWPELVEAE